MPRLADDRPLYVARSRVDGHFLCYSGGWTEDLEQCGHFHSKREAKAIAREEGAEVDVITLDEACGLGSHP